MNELETLYRREAAPEAFARGYVEYIGRVLARLDMSAVSQFIQTLVDARERDARVFFIGNGGSASTASHFANDVAIGSRSWHKPFRTISLCDNMSVVTALANDYGYEDVFIRQLQIHMRLGDVVVAISASGNSPNLRRAVRYANDNGATTVALTGFGGGELARMAQVVVHVPTNPGEYGPVEDVHLVLDHLVTAFLTHHCAAERAATAERAAAERIAAERTAAADRTPVVERTALV